MYQRALDYARPLVLGLVVVALTNVVALLGTSLVPRARLSLPGPAGDGPVFNHFDTFSSAWWLLGAAFGLVVAIRALSSPGLQSMLRWGAVTAAAASLLATTLWETLWPHNFVVSAFAGLVFMGLGLPTAYRRRSWKRTKDGWLAFSGVAACSVGGFGLVGLTDDLKTWLTRIAVERSEISPTSLAYLTLGAVLLLACAVILHGNGVAQTPDENGHEPAYLFQPMFWCAWSANVILSTVVFNSILLTAIAFLSPDLPAAR